MDLAIYITELLGFKGRVNVPGLGHFEQRRISGYFNVGENKFFPPRHEVIFITGEDDDDSLADFITVKKKISLASAKYFIEKYVSGIKQQATSANAQITGLGYLRYEASQLFFEADTKDNVDPAFYGLAPVQANPLTERTPLQEEIPSPVPETPEVTPTEEEPEVIPAEEGPEVTPGEEEPEVTPEEEQALTEDVAVQEFPEDELTTEPITVEPPTVIAPGESLEETTPQEEYVYEEEERRGGNSLKVIGLVVVIIALLALTGLYLYQPELFGKKKQVTTIIVKPMSSKPAGSKDTMDQEEDSVAQAKADSQKQVPITPKPAQLLVDTAAVVHYEILGGAFPSLEKANVVMARYETLGLHPRILKHVPGNLYKITLGTYFNGEKAAAVKDSILKTTKLRPADIYLQPYIPKKK